MKAKKSDRTERIGVGIAMSAFESQGFAFREQSESDYGIDAHAELIEFEQPTGRLLAIQIKSGPSYLSDRSPDGFIFRAEKKHVKYWQNHSLPVLICLCDIDSKTIYWQIVNANTATSTGKNYKFNIPASQQIDSSSVIALRDLLSPIVTTNRYSIIKTDDTSHGAAKRYSFKVVLNGTMSKAEVATIVRQITNEGQKRRYHRNRIVEAQWGDSDAHVIWTFIYPSAEDYARHNHICRSIWINNSLDPKFRPIAFDGEKLGDNIIVDWSTDHDLLAEHVTLNTLSKEDYFANVLPQIEELFPALNIIEGQLLALSKGELDERVFLVDTEFERNRINEIYFELTNLSFAPFECSDMNEKLQGFAAHLHNIWLLYSENGRTKWNEKSRLKQSLLQASYARETLQYLQYELTKVR